LFVIEVIWNGKEVKEKLKGMEGTIPKSPDDQMPKLSSF